MDLTVVLEIAVSESGVTIGARRYPESSERPSNKAVNLVWVNSIIIAVGTYRCIDILYREAGLEIHGWMHNWTLTGDQHLY